MKRSEIDNKYKWKMEDVYASEDLWEKDLENAQKLAGELENFKGRICENADNFYELMKKMNQVEMLVDRVYFYANQKFHEDLGDAKYQTMSDKASKLITVFCSATAYIEPEILKEAKDKIFGFINEKSELNEYRQYFDNLYRQNAHVLSKEQEEILALAQDFSGGASDIFTVFNNVDLKFPVIKDESGNDVQITHGKYVSLLESQDRRVRQEAFQGLYGAYGQFKNTLSSIYLNNVKKNHFYSVVRKYEKSRDMFLDNSNIPGSVYDNLVETVNNNLGLLHRYIALRKKVMKLDELHMYDVYVPMVKDFEKKLDYDEAKKLVLSGLEPMGEEYINILKEGFDNGWIDVYENEGKKSGAYSWATYGVHPYVLLNFEPNLNSAFTIAHEMGHALHSYYSNKNQTYVNSNYRIFVAEVASICNESLLINYLINNSQDKNEKAYLINHFLEQFRTTLFRQTMFAEFEDIVHKKVDNGEALNADELCDIYYELNKKYFGEDIVVDKEIALEWARIPHFYTAFYVYQYSTGFSAAVALSKKILEEGESAVNDYKKFLKAGCSDYPIEILKMAGVDMSSKEPVEQAMKMFEKMLGELERLLGE